MYEVFLAPVGTTLEPTFPGRLVAGETMIERLHDVATSLEDELIVWPAPVTELNFLLRAADELGIEPIVLEGAPGADVDTVFLHLVSSARQTVVYKDLLPSVTTRLHDRKTKPSFKPQTPQMQTTAEKVEAAARNAAKTGADDGDVDIED